jgi:uncharacterized protein
MSLLPFARFRPAALREVRPAGWLRGWLERQATGLTGNVAVSGYPYGYKFWGSQEDDTKGSMAAWWPYEQTAYWIDGALKCAYLAGDEALYRQALDEVDFAIEHAASDGFIGPDSLREKDRWPHTVFFRAVLAQYELSGDERYLNALIRHYRAMPHPMSWERDVTGVEILLELYQETGQADLLELAESLYARFNQLWPGHDSSTQSLLAEKPPSEHGVTFNEEAKLGALLYSATGRDEYLDASVHGFAKLARDARLADGLHSCSEHIHGKDALDSHETCDISDHTWALAALLQASGDAQYADQIERVIFNALPGAITKDFRALQYFSCPNQVVVDSTSNHNFFMRGLNWMSYRPDHEVQCCPGNLHRAMPNYVSRMWMRSAGGGIAAALYGPGTLETSAGEEDTPVKISAQTRYPYQEAIEFFIQPERPTRFAFSVRIPSWCKRARLWVNGVEIPAAWQPGSFFAIERLWQAHDRVRLELPFELALEHWPGGGVSLSYGPLTLALPIAARAAIETENSTTRQREITLGAQYEPRPRVERADFPAWNLTPAGAWNYALCVDEGSLKDLRVEWNADCVDALDATNPALRLRVKARRVRGWRMVHTHRTRQSGHWSENGHIFRGLRTLRGDFRFTPPLPDPRGLSARLSSQEEEIVLIPYGATLLRITVFPQG